MMATMLVQSEATNSFVGKTGPRSVVRLSLFETKCEVKYRQMLEYEMTPEEVTKWSGKLEGKMITIGISDLVAFGGRFGARGRILSVDGQPNSK